MKRRTARTALAASAMLAAGNAFAAIAPPPVSVPEPGALALLLCGLICVAFVSRRRIVAARANGG